MLGTSYHKYDTEDYMSIDPDFGTLDDMRNLRDEARKRGIKIIVDLAVNHSSVVHPWFLNAMEEWMSGTLEQYSTYYNIRTHPDKFTDKAGTFGTNGQWWRPDEMPLLMTKLNERRQQKGLPPITEVRTPNGNFVFYYGIFGPWMPDLNFDNPRVLREMEEIIKFWLDKDEMDLDGFRLDATLHIYNAPGDWQGDDSRNLPFWTWFVDTCRKYKSNVFLVGEAWTDPYTVLRYHTPGKSSFAFIFSLGGDNRIIRAINDGLGSLFSDGVLWYTREIAAIKNTRPLALFSPFITSHDKNRSTTQLTTLERRKMAASLLLLSPGAPFVYYGEEIGLWGEKPSGPNNDRVVRGPMIFSMSDYTGRPDPMAHWHWTQADWNAGQGLPVDDGTGRRDGVSEQLTNPNSLLRHYIRIQNMKKRYPWISWGRVDNHGIDIDMQGHVSAYRVTDDKPGSPTLGRSVVIAHNTTRVEPNRDSNGYIKVPRAAGFEAVGVGPLSSSQPVIYDTTLDAYWIRPNATVIFREY
jgi:glycosidase